MAFLSNDAIFDYYWRVKTRLPERFGHKCRVLTRGGMNSCVVEFEDGHKIVTSRNFVRRIKGNDKSVLR